MTKHEAPSSQPEYLTAGILSADDTLPAAERTSVDLQNSARSLLEDAISQRYPHITAEMLAHAPVSQVDTTVEPQVFIVEINVDGRGFRAACNPTTDTIGFISEF